MTRNDIILEARGLKRRFVTHKPLFGKPTEVRAVDGVDLQVRRGETLAIVGESGCGKSTLARLLVRLIEPSGGTVHYEGREIGALGDAAMRGLRRDLQFIFQDPFASLNPRMTVGALIEEPLRAHGIGDAAARRDQAAQMLTRVGLSPRHADRYPHEFSGGQRQRIGIARALACGPKVVIGDEPVSALDVSIQAQVVNLLEDLKQEFELTLIVIAHDLSVIRHMADRVAVMYLGQLVEIARTEDLFRAPRHPYTEALLAAIPLPQYGARKVKVSIEGDPPDPIAPPPGCRFHTRCPYAIAACQTDRPALRDLEPGHSVACLRAEELDLTGTADAERSHNPATERRFRLYREARHEELQSTPT